MFVLLSICVTVTFTILVQSNCLKVFVEVEKSLKVFCRIPFFLKGGNIHEEFIFSRLMNHISYRSMDSSDAENPGNNLYVTGLSSRVTKDELEKHFASEGKV